MNDRLHRVQPRTTYVIMLWLPRAAKFKDQPVRILGPFTHAEALRVAETLTCAHHIERLSTEVPPWATEPTGRMSIVDPALQTLPSAADYETAEALRRLAEGYEPH